MVILISENNQLEITKSSFYRPNEMKRLPALACRQHLRVNKKNIHRSTFNFFWNQFSFAHFSNVDECMMVLDQFDQSAQGFRVGIYTVSN